MPWVEDADGNTVHFPEDINMRFSRMIRARTVSYEEACNLIQELFQHMEPRDKDRLIKDMYREIERYYNNIPLNDLHNQLSDYEIAKMAMPVYKFRVEDGKIVDGPDIEWVDKTAKELDELLDDERLNFLSEQEMKI